MAATAKKILKLQLLLLLLFLLLLSRLPFAVNGRRSESRDLLTVVGGHRW